MTVFEGLIWSGAALTLAGVAALIWCIAAVFRARKASLDDAALRDRMRGVMAVNMAALGASMIGLLLVITGIMLG